MGKLSSINFNDDIYRALDKIRLQRLNDGDKHISRSSLVNELLREHPMIQRTIKSPMP